MLIVNGELVEKKKAQLSILDKGFLLGFGLFETMRLFQGEIIALEKHWERLKASALLLEITLPLSYEELLLNISLLVKHKQLLNSGFRLTISAGVGPRGLVFNSDQKSIYLIESFELMTQKIKPYRLCWSSILANASDPLSSIKSLSYLTHAFIKKEGLKLGFDDALQLTSEGFITESSSANFFMVKKNGLFTPPLSDGVLPGITRQRIIEYCELSGVTCIEKRIHKNEIREAEDVFLCNALMGIINVSTIEKVSFPTSPLTKRLKNRMDII